MIIDIRTLPNHQLLEADLCIVGAGVAGISLAREFIGSKTRVCLLESGGLQPDKATQSLYWGENIGHPYYELDTARARFFGGTSHFWHIPMGERRLGVRLRPLDAIDFETRDWVEHSGWPFARDHLEPYYQRAMEVCGIGPNTFAPKDWQTEDDSPLPLNGSGVETTIFQFGVRDRFFREYRKELEEAQNTEVYLHANALEVETGETAETVRSIRTATLDGKKFRVKARHYVLALGGIETPRLLLLSNRVQNNGLGNQNDLVGRFFMEHHHLWSGVYHPSDPSIFDATGLYRVHTVRGRAIMAKLALTEETIRREKLLNYCTSIHPRFLPEPRFRRIPSKGVDSLKELGASLSHGRISPDLGQHISNVFGDFSGIARNAYRKVRRRTKVRIFRLNTMAEQTPNPESRVTLMTEKDPLGQNRVQLNWQPARQDIRSIIRSQQIINDSLHRAGLGEIEIELEGDAPPQGLHGGWHHMGTTRMHDDPGRGVVDANSRVHDMSNLYIAGPSVFPTSGYANPVLTFVALTMRLADHLKKVV